MHASRVWCVLAVKFQQLPPCGLIRQAGEGAWLVGGVLSRSLETRSALSGASELGALGRACPSPSPSCVTLEWRGS